MTNPLAPLREYVARVVVLEAENAALLAENAAPLKTVATLTERVATLERLLGSGGRGGVRGTPPPTRPPSGRPRGGQRGHKSTARTRPTVIDRRRVQQNRSLRGIYRDVVLRSVAATCERNHVPFEVVVSEALLARTRDGPDAIPPTLRRALEGSTRKGDVQPDPSTIHAARAG